MKKALKIICGAVMGVCTFIVVLALIPSKTQDNSIKTNKVTGTNQLPPMVENVDYTQYVSIEDMDIQVTEGTTRGKAYITVKNNSNKELNYVRADIYFYDQEGNVVGSTFTNSGNSFLSGATQTLDRTVTWENNYYEYRVLITQVR